MKHEHPLLIHYRDKWATIHISSKFTRSEQLVKEFDSLITEEFDGWRAINDCFNSLYPVKKILDAGYGLLYEGPLHVGNKVGDILRENNIAYQLHIVKNHRDHLSKVLVLGENAIIAKDFNIEREQ